MDQRPVIGKEEFADRHLKLQALMQEKGVDLMIAYSDDRRVYGQAYARWLFDYRPAFEPACVLFPSKGRPVIATGAESDVYATSFSHCTEAKVLKEFLHPDEEYISTNIVELSEVLKELKAGIGKEIGTVACTSVGDMPHSLYAMFSEHFDMESAQQADPLLTQLRKIKSADEIKVIRYAYQIAEKGMSSALDSLKEGVSERDVATQASYAMRQMGAEGTGIELMVSFGAENTRPILSRPTARKLKKGDLVVITLAPRYEGYHGAIARSHVFGQEPGGEIAQALAYAKRALEQTALTLKPGNQGREADRVARSIMGEGGFGEYFAYSGIHSVGVVEFEPPIMSSRTEDVIRENMVLSVDIPIFGASWGGLRIEHGFLIGKAGAEPLMAMDLLVSR